MPVSGAEHRLQNLLNGSALVSRLLPSGKGGAPDSLCSSPIVKVRSLHLNNSTSLSSIVRTITSEASSSSPIRRWRKGGADSCGNRGRLGGRGSRVSGTLPQRGSLCRRAVDHRLTGRFALPIGFPALLRIRRSSSPTSARAKLRNPAVGWAFCKVRLADCADHPFSGCPAP
jgi:hypothetical protein